MVKSLLLVFLLFLLKILLLDFVRIGNIKNEQWNLLNVATFIEHRLAFKGYNWATSLKITRSKPYAYDRAAFSERRLSFQKFDRTFWSS